jgi:hypothetical protein
VIGGFHLPAGGGIFEETIDPTLKELQKIDSKYIILFLVTVLVGKQRQK